MQVRKAIDLDFIDMFERLAGRQRRGQRRVVGDAAMHRLATDRIGFRMACLPSVVLTMRSISSFLIMSTICGRPSRTLLARRQTMPESSRTCAVPLVATMVKPWAMSRRASATAPGLSRSRTLIRHTPLRGSVTPEPDCALAYASPKVRPVPMTSPVDFISGPRIGSASGTSRTGTPPPSPKSSGGTRSTVASSSSSVRPIMVRAAIFASGSRWSWTRTARCARRADSLPARTHAVLHGELDVHQAHDIQRPRELRVWSRISSWMAALG